MTSSQISPASTSISQEIQKLEPSAVITLFVLTYTADVNGIDQTIRYHAGTNEIKSNILFASNEYVAFPAEVTGFNSSVHGTLPRPKFKVSNVNNVLSAFIQAYNPLQGQLQRIQTCKKFLDKENFPNNTNDTEDTSAIFRTDDIWYIDRISEENPEFVEFELIPKINMQNFNIPRRQITEHCPWEYKGEECGFSNSLNSKCFTVDDVEITDTTHPDTSQAQKKALDKCGHKYSSCVARFEQFGQKLGGTKNDPVPLPFGGFTNARIKI